MEEWTGCGVWSFQTLSHNYNLYTTFQEFFFTVMPFYKYYDSKLLLPPNLPVKLTMELTVGFRMACCYYYRMPSTPRVTCIKSTHHIIYVFKFPNSLFVIDFWILLLTYKTLNGLCTFKITIRNSLVGLQEQGGLSELLRGLVSLWSPPRLFCLFLLLPSELIDWED